MYELINNPDKQQTSRHGMGRSSFIEGLAVGLGIGSIASFVIVWISLFFSPLLPQLVTYESLLATFIYPKLSAGNRIGGAYSRHGQGILLEAQALALQPSSHTARLAFSIAYVPTCSFKRGPQTF